MSSYDRCALHGLMRCAMCATKSPSQITAVVPLVPPAGFNPEDMLDGPSAKPAGPELPLGIDPQTQAAIDRQKAMQRGELIVVDGVEVTTGEPGDLKKAMEGVFHPEPPFKISKDVSPIVRAAEEYSEAESRVKDAEEKIQMLKADLETAEGIYEGSVKDRDEKKSALQRLVAS